MNLDTTIVALLSVFSGWMLIGWPLLELWRRYRTPRRWPGPAIRLPLGPVELRTANHQLAIVDTSTDTVLAETSYTPRVGDIVRLEQAGNRFTVTIADDPDELGRPVLEWVWLGGGPPQPT